MKRYLYLITIVLVIAIVVLIGILISRRVGPGTEPIDTDDGTTTPGGLPVAPPTGVSDGQINNNNHVVAPNYAGQKFSVVAENKAVDFFTNKDESVVLVQPDGQVFKIHSGQVTLLSSSSVPDLITTQFSYDGKKILEIMGNRLAPQARIFDVTSKLWQPLPQEIHYPSWSPTNYQIAYLGKRSGAGAIFTLDTSKTTATPQEILKIEIQDVDLRWTSQNQIILADKGSSFAGGSVWSFDIRNKKLTPFLLDNLGLDLIWGSAYGLVFSSNQNQRGGILNLFDAAGKPLHEMSFITLPTKCAFDFQAGATATSTGRVSSQLGASTTTVKSLYCAVPKNIEVMKAIPLPDSYFRKELFTDDEFYKVDLTDGKIDVIPSGKLTQTDALRLKVFNNTLFFINRLDNRLYAISLR